MSSNPPTSILLLKSPSPSPHLDAYTPALSPLLSPNSLPSTTNSPTKTPTFVPTLSHTLLPDPLIKLLLAYFDPASPRSSTPFPYGGVIITSQRAVAALGAALASPVISAKVPKERLEGWEVGVWVVGPATERAVKSLVEGRGMGGVSMRGGEEAGSGEKLAEMMLRDGEGGYEVDEEMDAADRGGKRRRKPVLFLVGETRRDIIPRMLEDEKLSEKRRVKVHEMVVYQSEELQSFGFDFARQLQRTKEEGSRASRWIVVFSPIGGKAVLDGLGWLDERTGKVDEGKMVRRTDRVCCIGPTTKAYLEREFGFIADVVAERPSPEGVRKGIQAFLEAEMKQEQKREDSGKGNTVNRVEIVKTA